MKRILLYILFLLLAFKGFGQTVIADTSSHNENHAQGIYVELLGGNLFYSIGYERKIVNHTHYDLSASIGLSTNFEFRKAYFAFGVPISINNRFKFWRFNGVDVGIGLGELINIWTIKNKDKYYTPYSISNPPIILFPNAYVGWVFRWKRFSISPRFYAIFTWKNPPYPTPSKFKFLPFLGVRGCYFFN